MKNGKLLKLALIAAVVAVAVSCSDANRTYVRKAVKIMDKNALFAQGAQWEAAKADALNARPATLEEAQELLKTALKVAGGKHSFLQSSESVTANATSEWPAPSVSFEEDGIAVIKLPPFSGNASEGVKYASAVLDVLPDQLPGVVIDLRGNTGGNMYPMIAAVHRFLPDGEILRFRTRKRTQWIMLENAVQIAGVPRGSRIECPVAILTDEWTASSGEAVLICFRGLDGVRVFGAPTAGYASANQPFPLPDGSNLVLTTGCDVARTGEAFCDDPIAPDQLVTSLPDTDSPLAPAADADAPIATASTDAPLATALAWLR